MRWTLDLTTGYLVLEPNPSLSPQPGHFPFLVLRFPTWLGLPTGTDSYQLHSIHAQNSSEERGHHPMDKCWWRWWWVIVDVPAGHIVEGWPEKECQVGRVKPDSEGSLGHLRAWAGAGESRECSHDRTLCSLKIWWIPFSSLWTHSSIFFSFYFSKYLSILKL